MLEVYLENWYGISLLSQYEQYKAKVLLETDAHQFIMRAVRLPRKDNTLADALEINNLSLLFLLVPEAREQGNRYPRIN